MESEKLVRIVLSPFVFVGGTAEAILKGSVEILTAGGNTIVSTITGGATRTLQFWDSGSSTESPAENETERKIGFGVPGDPFHGLAKSVGKACGSRRLIDNAEQIKALIRDGSQMGVEKMAIHCTKDVGAAVKGGVVVEGCTVGIEVSGQNDGTCSVEVTYK